MSGLMHRSKDKLLLDYLVGAGDQRLRHGEAECLGGFEINRRLEFSWRLHRKIGWFFAFEDAIDVARCTVKQIDLIDPIRDQAAFLDREQVGIDSRDSMMRCQLDYLLTVNDIEAIGNHDQAAATIA